MLTEVTLNQAMVLTMDHCPDVYAQGAAQQALFMIRDTPAFERQLELIDRLVAHWEGNEADKVKGALRNYM
jgi:hypothetical protein